MKKYKGIIFDLDGVICCTDQYHERAWREMAEESGIYFDPAVSNRLRGVSREESLEIILEHAGKVFSPEEKKKMAEKKNAIYIKLLDRMSPGDLEEDVRSTLEQLRNRGCLLAIGSSSKNTRKILDKIGLGNYFDAVCDGNEITHSKPDPEVFLKAAGKIGLAVSECLVVEDACAGISAASAGGFDSAGLGDAAKDKNVTWALNTFGDLKNIVK
ncbi:beta-phosphoglucomutase [Lachnospiraceae bacterium CLA-AA-H183]|uniref:beta-phosphoglucomutase n=1 Tax=Acetatifactor sp. TaxID=1872090 RepID=UPI0015A07870